MMIKRKRSPEVYSIVYNTKIIRVTEKSSEVMCNVVRELQVCIAHNE